MKRSFSLPSLDWLSRRSSISREGQSRRRKLSSMLSRSQSATSKSRLSRRRVQLQQLEDRHLLAAVSGEVFVDTSEDGVRQSSEDGAAQVRVYIDQNENGVFDPGSEPITLTDDSGVYSFPQLPEGDFDIRLDLDRGLVQTAPSRSYGYQDTAIELDGEVVRAARLFEMDAGGSIRFIGTPTRSRIDGLVRVADGSLIAVDTRANDVFRVDPANGERTRIGQTNLDIVGGLAYDRVDNAVYTLVRSGANSSGRTLARLDINTATAQLAGGGIVGLDAVADIAFDAVNRRIIGFDDSDDQFFEFSTLGAGSILSTADRPIDSSSLALADVNTSVLDPLGTATFARLFDSDDRELTATFLVDINTGAVTDSFDVDQSLKVAALTRSPVGNTAQELALTEFQTVSGVNFGIADDVIGFQLSAGRPDTNQGRLSQQGTTVVGGAIASDVVEISLNRQPAGDVIIVLNLANDEGGEPFAVLSNSTNTITDTDTITLTFTPDNWEDVQSVTVTPNANAEPSFVTLARLTASVDAVNSDIAWISLPTQTLPVRVLPPVDTLEFDNPVINEILTTGRFSSDVNEQTDQFLELRGQPNSILPPGSYFVVINEDNFFRIGTIETIIDLSGQQFGANGMLVLLQEGHTYDVSFGARSLTSDTTGFTGLPGGIYSGNAAGTLGDGSIFDEESYFLIQSDEAPVLGADIDTNDDGIIDPSGAGGTWTVLDSIAMHQFAFFNRSLASIVFTDDLRFLDEEPQVSFNELGQTIVSTEDVGYAARIGDSIGSRADDWVAGAVRFASSSIFSAEADDPGLFEFNEENVSYRPLFDRALDHVGESNFVGGVRGQILLAPSNGEIAAGETPAEARIPAEGFSVFVDTNGNGTLDDLLFEIEPDDVVPPFDIFNPTPTNATFPLTNFYPGVAISEDNSFRLTDTITSERQQFGGRTFANRIFSRGPFDWFTPSSRLRFDFLQPIKSASIDVVNTISGGSTFVYGRLEAYNAEGLMVATAVSNGVTLTGRNSVTVSAPGEEIVRVEAYIDSSFSNSTIFGAFDSFSYVQPEPSAVTDQNGIYEISGLTPGNYDLLLRSTIESAQLLTTNIHPFSVSRYENYFFTDEYRTNTLPEIGDEEFSVNENPPAGSSLGTVVASDADNAGLFYEILNSTISGLELSPTIDQGVELIVGPTTDLNFEADNIHVVTLRVSDPTGASATSRVTITVNDINEAPVVDDGEISVTEDLSVGDIIGRVMATDPDTENNPVTGVPQTLSFTEIGGDAGQFFNIDQDGIIRLAQPLDFEQSALLTLQVQVSDDFPIDPPAGFEGQTRGVVIADQVIRILDENDPPTVPLTTFTVPESRTGDLFTLVVSDPDIGQNHQFDLQSVTPPMDLRVSSEGVVSLGEDAKLDFERNPTDPSIKLVVNVSDNGSPSLLTTHEITINVSNVDESPTIIRAGGSPEVAPVGAINENLTAGNVQFGSSSSSISQLGLFDPEGRPGDYAFDLAPGPNSDLFDFSPITGELRLADGVSFNFEEQNSYEVLFNIEDVTGQIGPSQQSITVNVVDQNEAPVIATREIIVSEVPGPRDAIGTVDVTDEDNNNLQLEIVGGNAQNFFEFENATNTPGKPLEELNPFLLKVKSNIDFTSQAFLEFFEVENPNFDELQLDLRATDLSSGGQSVDQRITVKLNDVNEPPSIDTSIVAPLLANQQIVSGSFFEVVIPDNIAADPEGEDFLLRIFNEAGTLPNWLSFDPETRTLIATPGPQVIGDFDFTLRALEYIPLPLSDDFAFTINVQPRQNSGGSNESGRFDVTANGRVTALDALRIINFIELRGENQIAPGNLSEGPIFLDVSGEGVVSSLDALQVINFLNGRTDVEVPSGEQIISLEDEEQRRRETAIDSVLGEPSLF